MGLLSCFMAMLFHMSCLIDPGSTNYCSILDVSQKHTLYFVVVQGLRGSASLAYPHSSHIQESKEVTGKDSTEPENQYRLGALVHVSHRTLFGSSKNPFKRSLLSDPPKHYKKGASVLTPPIFLGNFAKKKVKDKSASLEKGDPNREMGSNALQDYIDQRLLH